MFSVENVLLNYQKTKSLSFLSSKSSLQCAMYCNTFKNLADSYQLIQTSKRSVKFRTSNCRQFCSILRHSPRNRDTLPGCQLYKYSFYPHSPVFDKHVPSSPSRQHKLLSFLQPAHFDLILPFIHDEIS